MALDKEPTIVINVVESILALLGAFGLQVSSGTHDTLILVGGAIFAAANLAFAAYNRQKVFSTDTVNKLLAEQVPPPVVPPEGEPAPPAAGG